MSRVGRTPVTVPAGVDVSLNSELISVKGAGGTLDPGSKRLGATVKSEGGKLSFAPANESREADAMSGTMRQLVNNMVVGVSKGFEKKLTLDWCGLQGPGARHQAEPGCGVIRIRSTSRCPLAFPWRLPTPTEILIKGADRQRVGQVAAEIRAIRPPEPYKGKGIRYADEKVTIKETKKK